MNETLMRSVVQTELDDLFLQKFNGESFPGRAEATTPQLFKQDTIDRLADIEATFVGGTYFQETGETEAVNRTTPKVLYKMTTLVKDYTDAVEISKNFYDDQMHGTYTKMVENMAVRARQTMNRTAFGVFRNGFTTFVTSDTLSLFNTSHPISGGGVQSNVLSGAGSVLSSTSLNDAVVALAQQKDQGGVILGQTPSAILVPTKLWKLATELTQSVLIGDTSSNAVNVYRSALGLTVWTTPLIDAAAGGSDTAWFMLSDMHSVTRIVRQGVETALVPWQYSNNRTYKYECNFREAYKASSWVGTIGSLGA